MPQAEHWLWFRAAQGLECQGDEAAPTVAWQGAELVVSTITSY